MRKSFILRVKPCQISHNYSKGEILRLMCETTSITTTLKDWEGAGTELNACEISLSISAAWLECEEQLHVHHEVPMFFLILTS